MNNTACRRIAVVVLAFMTFVISGARERILLSDGWRLHNMLDVGMGAPFEAVKVPHTWNVRSIPAVLPGSVRDLWNEIACHSGVPECYRGAMTYNLNLPLTKDRIEGKRLFLYFHGVNSVADVFVNKRMLGEHKGGYTAFCHEITDAVREGDNLVEVWVSNAYRTDVLPISGDFNIYGGIHRPVELIITDRDCISPDYYASPGVFIHQNSVEKDAVSADIETRLSLSSPESGNRHVKVTVYDADGGEVAGKIMEAAMSDSVCHLPVTITSPRLWQGREDPYLYTVRVDLMRNDSIVDSVTQRTGFRKINVDPEKGFFLNGKYTDMHGYCRHDDFIGRGSALTEEDYRTDMALIMESGANAMRLAHYPHGETIYDLADENGIMLWSETPMCGPGGMAFAGYLPTEGFEENGRQVSREMVLQKYNHPSICVWGLFNEVLVNGSAEGAGPVTGNVRFQDYGSPVNYIRSLNRLVKGLDVSRPTTYATCVDQTLYEDCADLIGWNKYFGWYGDATDGASKFFDKSHSLAGNVPVGVSEYGAGASVNHHEWPLGEKDADGRFHPEEAQSACHEGNWSVYARRPYLWCKFVWLFADIQSYQRREGEMDGYNDKGVITHDRKTKKDAFYFYKANWSDEPVAYISSRRFTERHSPTVEVKAYTNLSDLTLYVNGRKISKQAPDEIRRAIWKDVRLNEGENIIVVEGKRDGQVVTDECRWTYIP